MSARSQVSRVDFQFSKPFLRLNYSAVLVAKNGTVGWVRFASVVGVS